MDTKNTMSTKKTNIGFFVNFVSFVIIVRWPWPVSVNAVKLEVAFMIDPIDVSSRLTGSRPQF
jgi:hypothetical protein